MNKQKTTYAGHCHSVVPQHICIHNCNVCSCPPVHIIGCHASASSRLHNGRQPSAWTPRSPSQRPGGAGPPPPRSAFPQQGEDLLQGAASPCTCQSGQTHKHMENPTQKTNYTMPSCSANNMMHLCYTTQYTCVMKVIFVHALAGSGASKTRSWSAEDNTIKI